MKRNVFLILGILFLCIAIYGLICNNQFSLIVSIFSCIVSTICYYEWTKSKRNFWNRKGDIRWPKEMDAKVLYEKRLYKIRDIIKMNDNPQWDCTDAAHPAWWRGEKWGVYKAAELIADILSGKDTGKGVMNEPLETMRRSVFELKKERDELAHKEEEMLRCIQILKEQNKRQALRLVNIKMKMGF